MSDTLGLFDFLAPPLTDTSRVEGTFTYATTGASLGAEPVDPTLSTDANYMSAGDFRIKHDTQCNPPKNGWVNGSRVMCAMRQKNTGEYFPRVLCYVHIEKAFGADDIYLIQKCCSGSLPSTFPDDYVNKGYLSWTIRTGARNFMLDECVAYLGCYEGRNKL
jgi:hypothetical protein